jgi:hypothetical protein
MWPSDLGVPCDQNGKPLLLGDGLVWSAFNDADSSAIPLLWKPTNNFPHMPVEIHQSFYAREGSVSDTSLLANSAFMEWTFINKGDAVIESCYVGVWINLDVTDPLWNLFSIDTVTQTGYCWDSSPWVRCSTSRRPWATHCCTVPGCPMRHRARSFRGDALKGIVIFRFHRSGECVRTMVLACSLLDRTL